LTKSYEHLDSMVTNWSISECLKDLEVLKGHIRLNQGRLVVEESGKEDFGTAMQVLMVDSDPTRSRAAKG
jgi:hypothetical protein